jgi:hypothetical protein
MQSVQALLAISEEIPMGLLNRLFWVSLEPVYRSQRRVGFRHARAFVMSMVGYVMSYFAGGKEPVSPWELC